MIEQASHKPDGGRPTLRQVAEDAGVSLATASNALHQKRGVNADTMTRVFDAARKLGYRVQMQQRQTQNQNGIRAIRLITLRKHGLVIQDTPFFTELIHGLEVTCADLGYELIFSQITTASTADQQRLRSLLDDAQTPALLLATEMTQDDLALLDGARSPLLMLDSFFHTAPWWTVGIANIEAGYKAVRYLLDKRHRRIGLITSSIGFNNMTERQIGFSQALSEAGLDAAVCPVVAVEPTMEGSYRDFSRWLKTNTELPSAFFAANDVMAVGAMRALAKARIRVPDQMSLIGMDNTSVCQAVSPNLTSLHVYKKEIAEQAVSLLLKQTRSPIVPRRLLQLGVDVVERDSVRLYQASNEQHCRPADR